ncbi:MAG TPA: hypothetical protein VG936_14595 [Lacunisphaera sp.]|nr:hypothetical protein [Lacunisphaera sp.]
MPSLRRLPAALLVLAAILSPAFVRAAEIGPFTGPEADAEAARLYSRANAFVQHVTEGQYSYSYIQFHWKRASANVDRILRAYPSSPTAKEIRDGKLELGSFAPVYFKERVLPRLEEKKVASFDAVNCAIFLYGLETNKDEAARKLLLADIIETLCRQIRWGEALAFPILDNERPWLWNEVIRQTTIYRNDKLTEELLGNITADHKPELLATVAAGLGFRGESAAGLNAFLAKQGDTPALRAAILAGLTRRELPIERAKAANRPLKGLYSGVDGVQNPEQPSVDLAAWLEAIPAGADRDRANLVYARYLAALGRLDEARRLAPAAALAESYASHLVTVGDFEAAKKLPATFGLDATQSDAFRLALLEQLAAWGPDQDTAAVQARLPARLAAQGEFRRFRGTVTSTEKHLVLHEHTIADLPLDDPNLVGRLVCIWSLTPNRALRGAAPWDAIVYKFAPGFENLPPPKDKKKVEAAGR